MEPLKESPFVGKDDLGDRASIHLALRRNLMELTFGSIRIGIEIILPAGAMKRTISGASSFS